MKKDIKVLIITGSKENAEEVTVTKDLNNKNIYGGFIWDIWLIIKNNLKHKYNFKVRFTSLKENNYDNFVNQVSNNNYDMVVGCFSQNKKREAIVNFTTPFLLNANSILYYKKSNIFNDLQYIFSSDAVKILLFGLLIGLVIGVIIYFLDKMRYLNLKNNIRINKNQYLLRSVVTGISSMLGETGFLTEHVSLDILNIFLVVIILIISFVFILFLQASITKLLVNRKDYSFNPYNIKEHHFIGLKGRDENLKLKRYGAKITLFENKGFRDLIKIYKNNTDKYSGVVISYCEGYYHIKNNPELRLSLGFDYEPQSFIVGQDNEKLLEDLNQEINKIKYSKKLKSMCQSYFGNIKYVPVCKL